ncbi:MAG: hypothetical protein GWO20_03740 [Candidatus Korarchaeota archaeon]|nr:hypothetical protein [Candidatus Korarchaeota archaeon]NIU83623.1 hypothetical protein [Candidatus Thorarchaeota archaeon]NIW14131.1 hypothetical protein [Candidatus Thorarchaeota archaeon]NIW52238.1 hypothetical protein [Candidatus Korarchaeota archaeon]
MKKPKFILDEMLGSLLRWLRILGFDAIYAQELDCNTSKNLDNVLIDKTEATSRILLTKDVELAKRARQKSQEVVLLSSDEVKENLETVVTQLNLTANEEAAGKRCPVCNSPLETISTEKARNMVPRKVWKQQEEFWRCSDPSCRKVFWKGSHWKKIKETIELLKSKGKKENET